MKKIMNDSPGMQSFQFTRETPEGEVVSEQIRLQPGEIKELSDEEFEALKEHSQFQRLVDRRMLDVDPPASDSALQDAREDILHSSLSPKWIRRLSAKAGDVETVGQQEVEKAQEALQASV